jgi:hypothetical protein
LRDFDFSRTGLFLFFPTLFNTKLVTDGSYHQSALQMDTKDERQQKKISAEIKRKWSKRGKSSTLGLHNAGGTRGIHSLDTAKRAPEHKVSPPGSEFPVEPPLPNPGCSGHPAPLSVFCFCRREE